MDYKKECERWLENATEDSDFVQELDDATDAAIEDAFCILYRRRQESS